MLFGRKSPVEWVVILALGICGILWLYTQVIKPTIDSDKVSKAAEAMRSNR